MGIVKEIEDELSQKKNQVESIEDDIIKDSVLELAKADFSVEAEALDPTVLTRKAEVELGYGGKPVSRKNFFGRLSPEIDETEPQPAGGQSESGDSEDEDFGSDGENDSVDLDSDEDLEEGSDEDMKGESDEKDVDNETEYDSADDQDIADVKTPETASKSINLFTTPSRTVSSEGARGKSVRNQIGIWESLMACRIKIQPALIAVNKLYQKEELKEFIRGLDTVDQNVVNKSTASLVELMKSLLELQDLLLRNSSNDMQFEMEGKEDDESIPSDDEVDEEAPNRPLGKSAPKPVKSDRPAKKPKNYLDELYAQFTGPRDAALVKWSDKTRLLCGRLASKDFSAFDGSILKVIEGVLFDKQRLIMKTQKKRSDYEVLKAKQVEVQKGEENEEMDENDAIEQVPVQPRVKYECDPEIFDDDDFYHRILQDFIDRKSTDSTDAHKHGKQWLELQKLRNEMKKKIVDRRASKGRKIRYTVHDKLVNFMAPVPNYLASDKDEQLFKSLFGASA